MQKPSSTEQQNISAPKSLSAKELQDARQAINTFLLAWKNYGLYPEEHTASKKAIENLVGTFADFFDTHGDLRLTVEKGRLFYKNDLLYEVASDAPSDDIISLLYRDGIKWFEFQNGLTVDELTCFFKIAYKYRSFVEETEGDIVTDLMDEEVAHIDFKAVDIFWQDLLLIDFSQLNTPQPETKKKTDPADQDESIKQDSQDNSDLSTISIADPSRNDARLDISYDEYENLQHMVLEEENWDHTEDVFDVLLIILQSLTDPENFASVLDFTREEVLEAVEHDEFGLLLNLFESLHKIFPIETSPQQEWRRPLIDRFFRDISNPEIFDRITARLKSLTDSDNEKLQPLRQALLYLTPEIILHLAPVLIQNKSPIVQQTIFKVLEFQCQKDIRPLEKLLERHDPELLEKLLELLGRLQGDRVKDIFFKMRDYPADRIRRKAVKELVARDHSYIQKLFSLLDDPDIDIRSSILAAVAKQRSTALENMLLNYLEKNPPQKDPNHILACYRALGRCGSNRAIPFLSRILLNQGWNSFMGSGKLLYRQAAAIALTLLNTSEAKDILLKASTSKFRIIREASEKAMARSDFSGENTNG